VSERERACILVCDDEYAARRGARRALGSANYDFVECEDGRQCLEYLARATPQLVLLDLRMPVMDGHATLERIMAMPDPPPVVVVTADASIETAIEAVRAGAADYVTKPYEIDALRFVVEKTLETARLHEENRRLEQEVRSLREGPAGGSFLGESPAMTAVFEAIERVAPTTAPVLITGETGTGKELAARRIHRLSPVAGPFVTMNCAAIPEALVESELFGYRRGAFTGAERDRRGKFREADGGTLLLDEIGDMPPAVQAKLLRVLQDGVVAPLGGGGEVAVTVRVLASTHRDLRAMVAAETFREDLLFRLRVVEIEMPPLRERGEDVVLLARRFLDEFSARPLRLTAEAEYALRIYGWPGNVRELRNAIERAMIFCRGGIIQLDDLPSEVAAVVESEPSGEEPLIAWKPGEDFRTAKERVIERFERAIISAALHEESGNISGAAKALGLHRQNLQQKLRQLGIDAQQFNPARRL